MSAQQEYPAVVYQQLAQSESKEERRNDGEEQQQQEVQMVHTAENQAIINNSTWWVCCLLVLQMFISMPNYGSSTLGTFFPYVNMFMAIIGWIGLRHQRLVLIVPHFLYSMLFLLGLVMSLSLSLFLTVNTQVQGLAVILFVILGSSFLLRKQRLLIQALCARKVPVAVAADIEDPMVVELPPVDATTTATTLDTPPSAPSLATDQPQSSAYYPASFPVGSVYSFPQQDQHPVPVVIQTESGSHQVVYMYPVMPNPQ